MEPTSIDLRSIACRGVKSFNFFQKPSLYAVISVSDPSDSDRRQKKTAVDSDSGENPEWDGIFRFNLSRPDLSLEIDLMAQGGLLNLSGDKLVGKVSVPVADLLASGSDGPVRHVSYQVAGTDGKPNGVMSFTCEFIFPAVTLPPPGYYSPPLVSSPVGNYYPPPGQQDPGNYYPVFPSPTGNYYPPPRQQGPGNLYPVVGSPSGSLYHPPRQQGPGNLYPVVGSPSGSLYPPPRQQGPGFYPPPPPDDGYYPPPPPPPACCYPPPQEACCYPAPAPAPTPPSDGYSYGPQSWDRRLY